MKISISLDPDLDQFLEREKKRTRTSKSAVIRTLLDAAMKREKESEPGPLVAPYPPVRVIPGRFSMTVNEDGQPIPKPRAPAGAPTDYRRKGP